MNIEQFGRTIGIGLDVFQHQYDRFLDYLDTVPTSKAGEVFERFLKWEQKYVDRCYDKGIETNSRLFELVVQYFMDSGTPIRTDENFLSWAYELNGYTLKCYQGQGCYYRVTKRNVDVFGQ